MSESERAVCLKGLGFLRDIGRLYIPRQMANSLLLASYRSA